MTVTSGSERDDSTGDGIWERNDRSQPQSQSAIRKKCNQRKRRRKRKTQRRNKIRLTINILFWIVPIRDISVFCRFR
jgi:hypothetical protein